MQLFGPSGLSLSACTFGECVRQSVIDETGTPAASASAHGSSSLSGGVIAGLAVIGALLLLTLLFLGIGLVKQRRARRSHFEGTGKTGRVGVEWVDVDYVVPRSSGLIGRYLGLGHKGKNPVVVADVHVLGGISGHVNPGQMMAILGPSGE